MILDKLVKNEKDMLFDSAICALAEAISEQRKAKPSSKLFILARCVTDIVFYVNDLRMQREAFNSYIEAKDKRLLETLEELQKLKDEFYSYEHNTTEWGDDGQDAPSE